MKRCSRSGQLIGIDPHLLNVQHRALQIEWENHLKECDRCTAKARRDPENPRRKLDNRYHVLNCADGLMILRRLGVLSNIKRRVEKS